MKKFLFATSVAVIAMGSLAFAANEADIQSMKAKLLPVVQLILNSSDYTVQQKEVVRSVIKSCAKNNQDEIIRSTCEAINEETIPTEEENKTEENPENKTFDEAVKELLAMYNKKEERREITNRIEYGRRVSKDLNRRGLATQEEIDENWKKYEESREIGVQLNDEFKAFENKYNICENAYILNQRDASRYIPCDTPGFQLVAGGGNQGLLKK